MILVFENCVFPKGYFRVKHDTLGDYVTESTTNPAHYIWARAEKDATIFASDEEFSRACRVNFDAARWTKEYV